MSTWLPFPTWDGAHPLVIHFPIALLLVAPLFIVLGLFRPPKYWLFSVSALILMLLGTAGAYLAVETGEAAAQLVDRTPQLTAAIHEHQAMAENTRLIFTALTLIFMLLLAAPRLFKTLPPRWLAVLHVIFLIVYLGSCLVLARTAHLGGRLVHHFGVEAVINDPGAPPRQAAPSRSLPPDLSLPKFLGIAVALNRVAVRYPSRGLASLYSGAATHGQREIIGRTDLSVRSFRARACRSANFVS